jgi:hypothetical protein
VAISSLRTFVPSRLSGKKILLHQQKKSLPASSNQEGFFSTPLFFEDLKSNLLGFPSFVCSSLCAPSRFRALVAKKLLFLSS